MKKILRKMMSFFMALFMVLQVMLPAFATRSKAEEENPNSLKNIENINPDDESYFSITDSQKIYDKKKVKKDENKFSIAIGLPDTSSNFKLVKRNDLKLYDDGIFPTNEDASKEYWRVKDMLNDQGLDLDFEIIKEDQGYRIITKDELENLDNQDDQYGKNYSYINFKILDDFDFNEKGNQKILDQDKLVFNLEFITNISPDPNYNLFEKDEDGKWTVKNEGDIFALVNNDKVNVYDTSSLTNDLNSLESYKEEKTQAEEKSKKEAEEKKRAEEEKKAQEEKEKAEAAQKAEEEKKAQEEKEKLEAEKAEEEKKVQEKSEAENKENSKEEKSVLETDKKENKDEKSSDQKSIIEKEQDKNPEESLTMTNLEKADKELKEALKDENNSIGDIQKLLTELGEKYKLSRLDQEKLMSENDSAIKALVEKDREENFRPNMLRALQGTESNSFEDKIFHLQAKMNVKATDINPIPTGWYFDVKVGPYLYYSENQPLNDLYFTGLGLVATAQYIEDGKDHYIRYTFIKPVTKDISLDIDQNLKFDTENIGSNKSVDINIKVAPKNNPVQSMERKTVNIDDPSPVESRFTVEDQGETQSGTYPYQLNWKTKHQKLMNSSGSIITDPTSENTLEGAYVEWYIEVDTSTLVDENNKLEFEKLNLTVFGSSKQGLKNISYRFAKDENSLATKSLNSTSNLGELYSGSSSIKKEELGEKLYIKVRGEIDPNQLHESYSIGFRINPDKNYIDKLLQEYKDKFDRLPTPIKWIKGIEDAKRFAEVPFNLVETNIPATFNGLNDRFNNERFYYDNTRTIVAKRIDDTNVDWYALDLIRRGETQDTNLDSPFFYKNRINLETKNVNTTKVYYVPLKDGGYRKTYQPTDVILSNGQYYPGTIISYEYKTQKAGRNDTYYLRADLKDKKKYNVDEAYQTEGGRVDLFTEKISDQALANGYLAYTENPYPIMRINRNFDMVSCFNDNIAAPVYEGNKGVFLDIHEDPSGSYLISRLNESIATKDTGGYKLRDYLDGSKKYDDKVYLNHNNLTESQAMEELMKKIYFYGEEVKKEYANENKGKEMHRLIESSMYQRVIHHFTDGKSLEKDYFDVPSDYNVDEWKVDYTLTGSRISTTDGSVKFEGAFDGTKRKHPSGARWLKDNETRIKDFPPVQRTQLEMANELYKKVINSYKDGNTWDDDKADSVKLVFYSHTDEGKYQELITGRVMAPIEIDKYKKVNDKLEKLPGAEFTFTNINTGQSKKWKSTDSTDSHKLYLRPGTYRVQETETPAGYEKIKDFDITVEREEINGDDGPYKFKKLPKIHVNDGFKTKVLLGDNIPETADHKKLVELDGNNNIKVSVINIEDNLGKLEFIKRNKFIKLDGAEFTLRKIEASDLNDAKTKFQDPSKLTYDSKYDKTEKGNIGEFKFDQIPAGFYILEETKVPAGYEKAPLYLLHAEEVRDASDKKRVQVSFVQEYKEVTNEKGEKEAKIADAKLETEKATRDGKTVDLPIIRNKTKKTEIKFRKVRSEHVTDLDNEHLGLADARFRLMSIKLIDGDFYIKDDYTNRTKPTSGDDKVDGQNARGGGYITFEDLKVGEYLLQELQAPKGYAKTKLYGWKLIVSELEADDAETGKKKGDLIYKLYEIDKEENINNIDPNKEVPLDKIINGDDRVEAFQIGNESRKISIPFDKYLSDGTTPSVKPDGTPNLPLPNKILTTDGKEFDGNNAISFNLYKADYYGAILKDKNGNPIKVNKHPIVQNAAKKNDNPKVFPEDKYSFELHDLEFGGYYVLEEVAPPKVDEVEYKKASRILLKVEAEAIANEGHMKVIVRDPNPNAMTNEHSVFGGVINFEKQAKLGEFSIKKIGKAIPPYEGNVGLRRAYFRLYTADKDFNILYKDPGKKYPKEYIQKVTPGEPITHEEGGKQVGTDPADLPKNQGIVTFDQLKPGNYVLEEYRGPAGYEKDPNPWYIIVDTYGNVKKYRDNPSKTDTPRTMDYSAQSIRYKSVGLDISESLPLPRLMQAQQTFTGLEAFENSYNQDNFDIKVNGSEVDTKNGQRTIDISISPQDVPGVGSQKNLQYVFLIDRSQDSSTKRAAADAPNIDKNINKFLTDLAEKAKDNNANVDVTFIEYSRTLAGNYDAKNRNKSKLLGTYNQDLVSLYDKASGFTYNMKTQSFNDNNSTTAKDILGSVGISQRETITKTKDDGSRGLSENINNHYNQIISNGKKYDKRIVLNISNFEAASADFYYEVPGNTRSQKKYYIADNNWPFRDPGKQDKDKIFDSYVLHIEQKSRQETDYEKYMRNNSGTLYIDKSENPQQGLYTYKNFLESNLLKDEYFKANQTDGYLVKDAKFDLSLNSKINLLNASANITDTSGQTIIKQLSPNISKVEQFHSFSLENINLKKNESLKLSYTIDLKNTANYDIPYNINKEIKFTNGTKDTLISRTNPNTKNDIMTMKIQDKPNTYNISLESTGNGSVSVSPKSTGLSENDEVTITPSPSAGHKLNELKVINLTTSQEITPINNKFKMPAANVKVIASFIAEGGESTYDINTVVKNNKGGTLSVRPSSGIAGDTIEITAKPTIGYKLVELKAVADNNPNSELDLREYRTRSVFNTTDEVTRYFSMPASNVTVTAEYVPIGNMNIKANFTYSNQKDGEDDSGNAPEGYAGKLKLQVKDKNQTTDKWVDVPESEESAPYKGTIDFTALNGEKEYRLVYTRDENIAGAWGTELSTEIPIDFTKADKNNTVTVNISNGNLMEIFNKDETGFRIPLRITKVNENKGALTGSQFKARKILNGDKSLYKEINGKIEKTGESKDYPIYHAEKFDGVSEATGEPGDNYFRELTPGIYELTEIKAPDGTYRIPKDENGDPMKWYFQVFVYEGRDPRGADYMGINFNFTHKFVATDDFNKEVVSDKEKQELIGTTIEGLGSSNAKFNKYIEVVPDDGRSNPARPDAPYQGINDAQVTNYKSKTNLSFFKKDLETHKNLEGAEFSLRKVKTQLVDENGKNVEKPVLGTDSKPVYADDKMTDDKGKEYTDDQLKDLMVQPYHKDKDKVYALATSTENLGVEFTNIGEGTYILEETTPAKGYKPTDSFLTITFTEAEDGSWKQVVKGYKKVNGKYVKMDSTDTFFSKDKDGKFVSIANQKKYINFKFQKIRAKKGANNEEIPVNTASFKLTQVDENGKPVPGAKQWDVQSNFLSNEFNFKNLGVGRYKLQEIKVIEEFEKPDPWYFRVKDDEKDQGKLKIEFEKPKGHRYNSIDFTPYENSDVRPEIDENGNPIELKVKNFSRIKFKFQKLSDQKEDGKQLPLKDAGFSLKKLRYSMEDKAKAYEYYENEADESKNGALKKYSHGDQVTEFYNSGVRKKFTKGSNVYEFDDKGDLIKVNGQAATQQDKDDLTNRKVIPDSVSAATGKYYSNMRSQSDGGVTFEELGEGIYELRETKIPEGYQSENKQFSWIFEVKKTPDGLVVEHNKDLEKEYYKKFGTEESKKYYKGDYTTNSNVKKSSDNEFSYEITNTKTTTDLKWKKITNYEKGKLINQRTQFWLFKVSDDPTNPKVAESGQSSFAPYQVESSEGNFEIPDLSKGIYTLVETVAPDGYKKMERQIVIQIYEDAKENYKLKQNFYEMKREKIEGKNEYKNVLVDSPQEFTNLLTRKNKTEVDVDTDLKGNKTFYVNNEAKPQFFYLSKGFMKNEKGKDVFTDITKGELKIKIYADPADKKNTDTKVYERTIKLSDAKSYKIDVDGIKTGVDYLLEEVQSPDGFAKTKYKYRLQFNEDSVSHKFVAILKAVVKEGEKEVEEDGVKKVVKTWTPITNSNGQNITDSGQFLGKGKSINSGFPFQIVNKKTEIEFTKYGKDGEKETPLKDVEFYLEKQNPKDQKYYSLTENMEMILPAINDLDQQYWYYISNETGKPVTAKNFELVTPETHRGIYKSDDNGKFKITDLTDGYYRVMEPKAPIDKADNKPYMKVNGPVKTFRVVDGEVRISDKDDKTGKVSESLVTDTNKDRLGKIINRKPGKGEFKVKKYDDLGKAMSGIKFELQPDDASETAIKTGTTDTNGEIHFTDLPYGYYWLVETQTKDGYILNTKKKLVSLGGDKKWNVPNKNTDVSSKIKFAQSQKDLESTSGEKDVVHPNEEEAILARFKLEFTNSKEIKPGNYFTLKLSDNVDIDGIVKDKDGNGKSDVSNLNIVGPAGVLAKAEVAEDRRTITYTFTDYVGDYTPKDMELFLQLYPNRYKLVSNKNLTLKANIGESQYEKSINIDYRTDKGYQDSNIDVSSYMLRLEPDGKTFTTIIYYNQWNRKLTNKGIEFILDKNVDRSSLKVTTYKKLDGNGKPIAGSHTDKYYDGDLPDSYGIVPTKDKLTKVGERYNLEQRSLYNVFGDYQTKDYDIITLPYGYLNKGYAIDKNTKNNDPMDTTYVIEIKGKLADTNVKSLKTHVQYNHKRNWYTSGYDNYGYWRNNLLVGRYYAGAFKTWSQFYTPGASGNASKEMQVINFRNRIDFVKIDGGVKGEVPNTIPDENGNTQESSNFANDTIGEGLAGAEFNLKKDGSQDFLKDKEVTSDELGRFSWVGLEKGTYEVWETKAPDGYKLPKEKVAEFTVSENGQITLTTGYREVIANKKVSKIRIRKVDQDGKPIAGTDGDKQLDTQAGFSLIGDKVEGWKNLSKYTDANGEVSFEDIPAGNFELKEIQTPTGYSHSGKTWKLTVAKDGRMAWTNSFDDEADKLKAINETSQKSTSTNLETKIVGIDKDKKVFRQYNIIKANKDDLKNNKITISSPDTSIKLNQDNTKVRLVALDGKSKIDNLTPIKDEADYQVTYNNSSMDVSIKLPEEKNAHNPVGEGQDGESKKQKTYLLIVDLPYTENSKVGAEITYNKETVNKSVENDKAIKQEENNQSLESFKDFYRPRLVNDLDFVIENIKKPDIYFKKVDEKDNNKALAGAEFEIQKKNENGEYKAIDKNGNEAGLLNKWTSKSDEDGHFGFSNIPDGKYQIFETKAPDGYALVQNIVFKFVVKNGKIEYKEENDKNNPKIEVKLEKENEKNSKDNRFLITNKKAQYPSTGGPGVWIGFTILGLVLMFIAVLTYWKRKDKLVV